MRRHAPAQMRNVYGFTLRQHVRTKGYRMLTVIVAALLLVGISLAMAIVARNTKEDKPDNAVSPVTLVAVADTTNELTLDWSLLSGLGNPAFSHIAYQSADTPDAAAELCRDDKTALIAVLSEEDGAYSAQVLLPEGTELTRDDAQDYSNFLQSVFPYLLAQKYGLDSQQQMEFAMPIITQVRLDNQNTEDAQDNPQTQENDETKKMVNIIFTYATVMLLYIMIMAYGQETARSTLDEKTSKLMDTFLVAVRPRNLVMGKVLAMVTAGLLQFFVWIAGAAGGFWLGSILAERVNPAVPLGIVTLFKSVGALAGGMFSVAGIVIAVLTVIAGFLLYCALAAFGGSMASKPEDLGSANMLFSLLLVASYLVTFFSGAMSGNVDLPVWIYYFPFSAVLVMPAAVLTGSISVATGLASLLIIIVFAYAVILLAGKTYVLMTFYKGNPPTIGKVLKMLRAKNRAQGSAPARQTGH